MIVTTTSRSLAPSRTVLHIAGEIDTFAAYDLRRLLRGLPAEPGGTVVVDLSAVTFMSCSALSVLAEAQARLGPRLVLGRRSRIVTRLFGLTGLGSLFSVLPGDGAVPQQPSGSADEGLSRTVETAPPTWTFSRTDVERVRGLLMGVHGCDAEEAWQLLARSAAQHGVPVGELVELLIGGRLDSPRAPSSAAAIAALTVLMRTPHGDGPSVAQPHGIAQPQA